MKNQKQAWGFFLMKQNKKNTKETTLKEYNNESATIQ